MKKIFTLLLSILFVSQLNAQTISENALDGVLYIKVKINTTVVIPYFEKGMDKNILSRFPILQNSVDKYEVTKIYKPFKTKEINLQNIYRIHFNKIQDINQFKKDLGQMDELTYIEVAPIYKLSAVPNDVHANQWYFNLIKAPEAFDITTGKANIIVAVVDDACKISHPDLNPSIYTDPLEIAGDNIDNDGNGFIDDVHGYDVADSDNDPEPPASHWMYNITQDVFTHGTHCSGIMGAATNNSVGIASIGNGIKVLPVKCTANSSIMPTSIGEAPLGVDYAVASGADVISMSWGGAFNQVVADAVNAAHSAGIVLVAAAGNDGDTTTTYPSALPGVISVGAITKNDVIASFSQRNPTIDVMAPGDSIWSTLRPNNGYGYMSGTSMACPMVAGLCGLLLSYDSTYTPDMIEACLKSGCDNIDAINPTTVGQMGAGRVNAYNSLMCMTTGVNAEFSNSNQLKLYPNPANDFINIELSNFKANRIEIYNNMGQMLVNKSVDANSSSYIQINTADLKSGLYILKVSSTTSTISNRFIIK
ncbi:MAG: S8 family serine peptidase [Bacteroidota bacterium]